MRRPFRPLEENVVKIFDKTGKTKKCGDVLFNYLLFNLVFSRLLEWSHYLEETFSSVVMTSTFPRSQLDIFIEISNADGGVLPSIFNAVTLALLDAGIPMEDYVLAGSVSYVNGHFLLDPNRLEESSACPVLTAALLPRSQKLCFLNSELRLASDKLPTMLELLKRGVGRVFEQVDAEVVRPYLYALIDKKNNKQ